MTSNLLIACWQIIESKRVDGKPRPVVLMHYTFAARAKQTTLPEIAGFDPDKLDSRHFWEQMNT
ncbi:MAG: hypothetical protein M1609_14165, partial [Firmicutes bacterium]|nr:hypothetical protein [Bacillota bacterium]